MWHRWKATAIEWLAVVISCAAMMVSIISMFVAAILFGVTLSQGERISELNGEVDILLIRTSKLDAYLRARGVPVEEIYDESNE